MEKSLEILGGGRRLDDEFRNSRDRLRRNCDGLKIFLAAALRRVRQRIKYAVVSDFVRLLGWYLTFNG